MVLVPKTTVVDGEKEVKREEPDEGEEVDIGNESSEHPLDSTVNETQTSGDKRRGRGVNKTAAQLRVLRTAFQQDPSTPPTRSDQFVNLCDSTGLEGMVIREWFKEQRKKAAKKEKKQQSSNVAVEERWVKKSAAQCKALITAFRQDPSTPLANSARDACLRARTGLNTEVIRNWFNNRRNRLAKKEKIPKATVVDVPPTIGRMERKRDCEAEREEEEEDRNPVKKQKISAQKGPKNLKTSHGVKSAESGDGGDSGSQITVWSKKKDSVVVENVVTSVDNVEDVNAVDDVEVVEEVQDSEDNDIVVIVGNNNNNPFESNDDSPVSNVSPSTPKLEPPVVDNNDYKRELNVLPVYPKVEPQVVNNNEYNNYADSVGTLESYRFPAAMDNNNENDIHADIVSPLDYKLIPPAVLIACRDRENSDKGKPKQCALCLEDKPNDRITSFAEAAQLDAQFGSNLTGFLKYGECVLVCDHHLTDFYELKNVERPEPVTTVSSRSTKCTICGGERIASVPIVSLKEAASLDEYHGSRVFDALHFSFAIKVCRMHREDLVRYQKAINNQQL